MGIETGRRAGLLAMLVIVAGIFILVAAKAREKDRVPPRSTTFEFKFFDLNTINCTINSSGPYADFLRTGQAGLEWPKGSGRTAVFSAGIWLIGKHTPTGELRTAVMNYSTEYKPGPILSTFNTTTNDPSAAGDPNDSRYRIYKIERSDTVGGVNPDYDEWPTDLGAPVDEQGRPKLFGDQQLWLVCNDADPAPHVNTGCTPPMGIEIHALYFGLSGAGVLANTMVMKWLIMNKSDATYEDVYFSLWSDIDLGNPNDDLASVDSTLDLALVYNGDDFDESGAYQVGYSDRPPSGGFVLLQGLIVPGEPSDSARFGTGWRMGFKNLSATSHSVFLCGGGGGEFTDPPLADSNYASIAHGFQQGLNGTTMQPYVDPTTNRISRFVFSGDPVAGTGWLPERSNINPCDSRGLLSSGPFTLARGDTQEVFGAFVITQGEDRLNSVRNLKDYVRALHFIHRSGYTKVPPPLTHIVRYDSPPSQSTIELKLDEPGAISATALFVDPAGTVIDSVELFDDGLHNDSAAGDGIFVNSWSTSPLPYGLSADVRIGYSSGEAFLWRDLITRLTTAGPITVPSHSIASDNINSDGFVNPGENVRYVYSVTNGGNLAFSNVSVAVEEVTDDRVVFTPGETFSVAELGPQAVASLVYDENNPSSYFSFEIPEDVAAGTEFSLLMEILDDSYNRWVDTLDFVVAPYAFGPISDFSTHTVGNSEGTFGVVIVNYPDLRDHTYELTVVDSIDEQGTDGLNLVDATEGRVVFTEHPLPDVLGHNMPVLDGFKVIKGTALYESEYPGPIAKGWDYTPAENRFITGKNTSEPMDTFFGGIAHPRVGVYVNKGTAVSGDSLKRVEITFSNQTRQKAYRYLSRVLSSAALADPSFQPYVLNRGAGYVYQDYVEVPFTIWEVDRFDGNPTRRQINVAFLERNDSLYSLTGAFLGRGKVDGQWFPTTANNGGGEVIYILASSYSDQENQFYTSKNLFVDQNNFDILYVMWPRLDESLPQMFTEGDVFTIVPQYPPVRPGNLYSFNPVLLEVKPQPELPIRFALYQNYPNPFNPATAIEYELPKESRVTLKIFDILGREVITLVDEMQWAGRHLARWEGTNNISRQVSSGVYLYRLQAGEWTSVKKMVFIR